MSNLSRTVCKPIHIAAASTMSRPADLAANLDEIAGFAEMAGEAGADILLTPELSACGYGFWPDIVALAEKAGSGPIYRRLAKIAKDTGVVVCAGFPELCEGKRFIAHYVVYPDERFFVQRKNRPMQYEAPFESPYGILPPKPGEDQGQPADKTFEVFEVRGVKCAIVICADGGIEGLNDLLASKGVELLLAPTGGGGKREDRFIAADMHNANAKANCLAMLVVSMASAQAACMEYRRALAAANICGYDGREFYHGGGVNILNCFGELVGYSPFLPILERQRPMFAHAIVDVGDTIDRYR